MNLLFLYKTASLSLLINNYYDNIALKNGDDDDDDDNKKNHNSLHRIVHLHILDEIRFDRRPAHMYGHHGHILLA